MFNNEFSCPDGHKFTANAKIRARCPECGKQSRRTYAPKTTDPETPAAEPVSTEPVESKPPEQEGGITLIRRGRPKALMPKRATPPKDASGKFVSAKTATKTAEKTTGIVTKKTLAAGSKKKPVMPRVVKRPPRTAIARHIAGGRKSYADEMIETYGFRRG